MTREEGRAVGEMEVLSVGSVAMIAGRDSMLLTTRMVAKIVRPDIALGSVVRTEGVATFHQRVGHFSAKHFSIPYWRNQF